MNKRVDYLFKALTLRLLLAIFRSIRSASKADKKFEAEVEACADECAEISDEAARFDAKVAISDINKL